MDKRIDHGGTGPKFQMLHANGYPPECYETFLTPLTEQYQVYSYRQRPLWSEDIPNNIKGWKIFAEDLIAMMDQHGDRNVIGAGHSLGGIATLLAAIKRPDLFERIILIDPVIPPYWALVSLGLMPDKYKSRLLPLIKMAEKRRYLWKDREEARAHLGSKKVYQRFHHDAFEAFLQHGLKKTPQGRMTLSYSREWEAAVYRSGPNIWPDLSKCTVPVHIVKAEYSDVITKKSWPKIQGKIAKGTFYEMPNVGHLIPFEKPSQLADHLLSII